MIGVLKSRNKYDLGKRAFVGSKISVIASYRKLEEIWVNLEQSQGQRKERLLQSLLLILFIYNLFCLRKNVN